MKKNRKKDLTTNISIAEIKAWRRYESILSRSPPPANSSYLNTYEWNKKKHQLNRLEIELNDIWWWWWWLEKKETIDCVERRSQPPPPPLPPPPPPSPSSLFSIWIEWNASFSSIQKKQLLKSNIWFVFSSLVASLCAWFFFIILVPWWSKILDREYSLFPHSLEHTKRWPRKIHYYYYY